MEFKYSERSVVHGLLERILFERVNVGLLVQPAIYLH
jgi:hypothetical protein